jgi:hypothetical protein
MMQKHTHPLPNRIGLLLLLLATILLAACVRQISPETSPTPRSTNLLEELLTATSIPIETQPQPTEETPAATTDAAAAESATPAPTNTMYIITPTLSPTPTSEVEATTPAESTSAPTQPPQAQPTSSLPQINPDVEFTGAKHVDTLDQPALWYDASGVLPDTQYLKMDIADGIMTVTGKLRLWDTWWISGFTLNNFYIEMEVNSGECNPDDAYGMILRASLHGEPTHGYLVAFTCDGKVFAKRQETVSPYTAISILNPTETDLIYAGKNQTNILGVLMDGDSITIYPNRRYFTIIQDDAFSYGRYGIFVQAGDAGAFTYTVSEIRTWGVQD